MPPLSTEIHKSHSSEASAANDKVKLKKYLSETVAHLMTIDGSREDMKEIAEVAAKELEIDKKVFIKAAKLIHKNKTCQEESEKLDEVQDLIDKVTTIS